MTEEEFRLFLQQYWRYLDEIEEIVLEASDVRIELRQKRAGTFEDEGTSKLSAWVARKRFAVSIFLRETGVATTEELMDDLDSDIEAYERDIKQRQSLGEI